MKLGFIVLLDLNTLELFKAYYRHLIPQLFLSRFWLIIDFPLVINATSYYLVNTVPQIALDILARRKAICPEGALSQVEERQASPVMEIFQGSAS